VAAGILDLRADTPSAAPIRLRTPRVNALLGTDLADDDVRGLLAPIGFVATPAGDGAHDVVPPSFRPDATTEIDLVEEVARHHGYSRIARTVPNSPFVGGLTSYQRGRRHLRDVLVGAGVSEAASSPLLGPGDNERAGYTGELIEASDPLAREESVLRASLLPSLLKSVARNASYRNADVALFEIGKVFRAPAGPRGPLPDERELLGMALTGAGGGAVASKQLLDVVLDGLHRTGARVEAASAPGLHPTRTASVLLGADLIGYVGEVDPDVSAAFGLEGRVGWIELDLAGLVPAAAVYPQSRPIGRHPSSDVDLAFVVDDGVPAAAVLASIRQAAGPLLEDLRLFDVYRHERLGAGRRSLALRLRLQAPDRTLTDADVAEVRARCIDAVAAAHKAELRA
jgi:phenylalanyl-tRNA synthetase beta chain